MALGVLVIQLAGRGDRAGGAVDGEEPGEVAVRNAVGDVLEGVVIVITAAEVGIGRGDGGHSRTCGEVFRQADSGVGARIRGFVDVGDVDGEIFRMSQPVWIGDGDLYRNALFHLKIKCNVGLELKLATDDLESRVVDAVSVGSKSSISFDGSKCADD